MSTHVENPADLSIAVIVCTQNHPNALKRCLHSLASQQQRPDEVVVVNDGGDAIYQLLSQFTQLKIHLIDNDKPRGQAAAFNQGLQAIDSQAVAFLNDDCVLLAEHLQTLAQVMCQFDSKVAYAAYQLRQQRLHDVVNLAVIDAVFDTQRLAYENYMPLATFLFQTALIHKHEGFDEHLNTFEDWDLLLRLAQQTAFQASQHLSVACYVSKSAPHSSTDYQAIIQKHIQTLTLTQQNQLLGDYWVVSQQRANQLQQATQEVSQLKQTLSQQAKLQQQIKYLQQENSLLKTKLDQVSLLESTVAQLNQRNQHLEENRLSLSKQLGVGISHEGLRQILLSNPPAYATSSTPQYDNPDYQRLADWVEQHLQGSQQQQQANNQVLLDDIQQLKALLAASRWPQVRRYIGSLETLTEKVKQQQILNPRITATESDGDAAALSELYPTFVSYAQDKMMENVTKIGTTPFHLEPNKTLLFSTYCQFNHFSRLDILLATKLRINFCHLRLRIRVAGQTQIRREAYVDALRVMDNHFHSFEFEPLPDSAGVSYELLLDSPDADEHNNIAIWCHDRAAINTHAVTVNEDAVLSDARHLPAWVQQNLQALPINLQPTVQAEHILVIQGLQTDTPRLQLHILLNRISQLLAQNNMNAQVWVQGNISDALKQDLQQQHIDWCPANTLLDILAWAASSTGLLWLLDIDVLPALDSFATALTVLQQQPQAALLLPMEIDNQQQIRSAYALALRDGTLNHLPINQAHSHPYHRYLREVNATSSELLIVRRTCINNVDLSACQRYQHSSYQLSDLIWQLQTQEQTSFYCGAITYVSQKPPITFANNHDDAQQFHQRWAKQLPQTLAEFSPLYQLLNPAQQPTALIINDTLPTFNQDSASLRLYTIMKIWRNLGYKISFIADHDDGEVKYRHALEALGIEVFYGEYTLADAFSHHPFDYAFICRVAAGQRYIPFIRFVSPTTQIFYDTVDIHYVREQRQAEIENSDGLAQHARLTKHIELSNCRLADKVLTVTDDDGKHLQKELPFLDYAVIANVHAREPEPTTTFAQRDGLVFIGNYQHKPNEDAMYAFIEEVLPLIQQKIADIKLYIIGSHMPEKMQALASDSIQCVGWVDEVSPAFAKRRVFVSYLRYGAGMKGKIGQALALGLPVVSTDIGAEGMGLLDHQTALIANEAQTFADAVVELYNDAKLWQSLSEQGREHIEQAYGETAMQRCLLDLLA